MIGGPPGATESGAGAEQPFAVAAPGLALPKGGGAIRGMGENFRVNPATGTASMSVPVAASPGRAGFGPLPAVGYDSGAGNGVFGLGWSIGLPAITRKTDQGLPRYFDDSADPADWDVYQLAGADDLVPEIDADGRPVSRPVDGHTVRRYRPRVEGTFARIEQWRADVTGEVHWRSISRDNVLTVYGADERSRIADPADARRVFSWLVCQVRDDRGEVAVYDHAAENADGVDLDAAHERHRGDERSAANQRTQIKNAQEIEYFLTGEKNPEWTQKVSPTERKRAGRDLYTWLQREVRGLHSQAFQLAFDLARKAERALQQELGDTSQSYLQFSYLEGKEGLLAGERLALDIKRMELAYHERNAREYELTRHISLMAVDPTALLRLRKTGRCTVALPEALFDLDGPGHYFRRIRSVALSLPCVTGPYTSVNCRLTLLRSSIRTTDELREGEYARQGADDSRFSDAYGAVQSIVTSTGNNDAGLFDSAGGRDDRYVPFEYAGAISDWQLELPADPSKGEPRQFDFDTISDAVLHLRYTAREGGERLRRAATTSLTDAIGAASAATTRLFSVRGDFPTEWARLRAQTPPAGGRRTLTLALRAEHYPFWSRGRLSRITGVRLYAQQRQPTLTVFDRADAAGAKQDVLVRDPGLGNLVTGRLTNVKPPATPVGEFTVYLESADFDDLWFAVDWAGPT